MIRNFIRDKGYEYYADCDLYKYNTYRIHTICNYLIFPHNEVELLELLKYIKDNNLKYLVIGNGSNIIFKNKIYEGIVIKLDRLNSLKIDDNIIEVGAGYSLIKLSMDMAQKGLSGLEFASGIPGYVGASVAMNAGAYNMDMSCILKSIRVINSNMEIVTMTKEELDFSYRDSFLKNNKDYIVVSARLKLEYSNKDEILELISKRRVRRIETQPLEYPSAGSVFRNPEGMHAGELIEKCELKGFSIGGAMVSSKHANFIINNGNANGEDIINLINLIKSKVYDKYKVQLILEQIIIE